MKSSEKLKLARQHLKALGLSSNAGAPPIVRVFWLFHIPVPPFFFWHPISVALFTGAFFGTATWFICWAGSATSLWIAYGVPVLAGAAFGLNNAYRARAIAREFHLPLWAQYSPEARRAAVTTKLPSPDAAPSSVPQEQSRVTKVVRCPHCGHNVQVRLLAFIPKMFGPHFTCPTCHERCAVKLSTRMFASGCGFVLSMAVLTILLAAILASHDFNMAPIWAAIIISVIIGTFTKTVVAFKFCVLVKSRIL
jgi:hypothetical protein